MAKQKIWCKGEIKLLFMTGFLGLSTLSTQIMEALHLPYLIELFFLPIILFYLKRNNVRRIQIIKIKPFFLLYLFYLFNSCLIGVINTGEIFNIFTCIRPFIYLSVIAYCCAQKKVEVPLAKVYFVVLGALFGELVNKLLFMNSIASIDHINTFALAVFVIIPFVIQDRKKIIFSVIFGLIMAVLTLYRRELVVFAAAFISGILFGLITRKSYKKIVYVIGMAILGYIVFTHIEDILVSLIRIFKLDNTTTQAVSATYRIIKKFQTTDSASDAVRIHTWSKIFTDFYKRIFPRGPVGKAYGLSYFGAYTDSTNVFLYDVFGSVLSWMLILFILYKAIICVARVVLNNVRDPEVVLSALMVPVFLVCLATDGTFLVHANISLIAGYAIHGWFVKKIRTVEKI